MGERLFCFSLRVLSDASAKFGGIDEIFTAVDGADGIANVAWLAAEMMEAGNRYAKRHNIENPAPLSADDILDELEPREIMALRAIIFATINNDSEAEVKTQTEESENPTQAG